MPHNHEAKDAIQQAALVQWRKNFGKGTIAGATGMGKSKIAIDAIRQVREEQNGHAHIAIIVPTEELRDQNWPAEIRNWCRSEEEYKEIMQQLVIECYASVPSVTGHHFDLVVLDEIHHLTVRSESLFTNNRVNYVLGLTATPPKVKRDEEKYALIAEYAPVVFTYSLDQGVEDGVVADFEIIVVMEPLDAIAKVIKSGTKAKPFMTTEAAHYAYLDKVVKKTMAMPDGPRKADAVKFTLLKRTRFIYNLPSKTRLAKEVLKLLPESLRIITFCGSIEQCEDIFGENVYHSKSSRKGGSMLQKFKDDLSMTRLGVVSAVDEGHNIPMVDGALIVQTNSNDRTMVQRIGRIVRYREGHKAFAIVLCTQGTQDEQWIKKALAEFPAEKIRVIRGAEIYTGKLFENS